MSEYVVELKHITKRFPGVVALKDMSIGIRPGEIHGLIGENGAGKSTLINCILNIVPYEGEIKILGKKLTQDMFEDIGVYLDDAFISNVLTINQIAKVYKLSLIHISEPTRPY